MKCDYDVLFLSILYPRDKDFFDKNVKGERGHNISKIQYALIDGFNNLLKTPCKILNTLLVPTFPKGYAKLIVHEKIIGGGV